jgi:hypothetical protein
MDNANVAGLDSDNSYAELQKLHWAF